MWQQGEAILQRLHALSRANAFNNGRCLWTLQSLVSGHPSNQYKHVSSTVFGCRSVTGKQLDKDHCAIAMYSNAPIRHYRKGLTEDVSLAGVAHSSSDLPGSEVTTEAEVAPRKPKSFIESLHTQLRESDVDATLNLVSQFYNEMVTEHVFHSIVKIYNHLVSLSHSDRDGAITDLKSDERFQLLCAIAAKKGRFNTPRQVLRTVNTLTLMKFDSDNKVMQVFLELSKHHVNSYHCAEIVHFGFLLSKCQDSKQVFILKQQLALALKLVLNKEIQFLHSPQLCNLLEAFGESLDQSQMMLVLDALLIQKDSSKFKSYETVLKLLAKLKQRDVPLIKICLKNIQRLVKVDKFSYVSLLTVLNSLVDLHYDCQQTFTDIANNIASKDLSTAELCGFLNAFLACRNCPTNLMDSYVSGLGTVFDDFEIETVGELNWFLRPLALFNWKDGRLVPILMKMKQTANHMVESQQNISLPEYTEMLLNLLVVGFKVEDLPVRNDLLHQCIEEVKEITDSKYHQVSTLYDLGLVCLAHKASTGKDLGCTSSLKDALDTIIDKRNNMIQPYLSRILGGDAFTADKVFESGLLLGQVFVVDKDQGTMPAQQLIQGEQYSDRSVLIKPDTSSEQRYAICFLRVKHVLKNTRRLTGPIQLQMDLLNQLGYNTVGVVPHVWDAVPEMERLDLLKFKLEVAKEDGVAYII